MKGLLTVSRKLKVHYGLCLKSGYRVGCFSISLFAGKSR